MAVRSEVPEVNAVITVQHIVTRPCTTFSVEMEHVAYSDVAHLDVESALFAQVSEEIE